MSKYYIYNIKDEFKYVFKNREKAFFEFACALEYHATPYLEKQANIMLDDFNNKELCYRFKECFANSGDVISYRQLAHLHVLEDLEQHEITYLKIERRYLILEASGYDSQFIKVILQTCGNYVIINFENNECFWLDMMFSTNEYGG